MSEYAVQLKNITKTFGSVVANNRVDLNVRRGEILALLGENGSGKTTLMNMLSGIYRPDKGQIFINGTKMYIDSPEDAKKLGIGMIHQHFKLIEKFTAADNIWMGVEKEPFLLKTKFNYVDSIYPYDGLDGNSLRSQKLQRFKVKTRLCLSALNYKLVNFFRNAFLSPSRFEKVNKIARDFGFDLDSRKKVCDMAVSEKQTLEIVKVLYYGADILILDEPTAVLTTQEIQKLFSILRKMKEKGCAIIIITHKLNEVLEISDRVTVLRKGENVGTIDTKDANEQLLTELMVGEKVDLKIECEKTDFDETLLSIKGLTVLNNEGTNAIEDVSFDLKSGEILGVAGISGCGQKELCESIAGLLPVKSGEILYSGENIAGKRPLDIINMGISMSFIPEDRLGMGLAGSMSVADNMILKTYRNAKGKLPSPRLYPFVDRKNAKAIANKVVEELEVSTPDVDKTPVRRLSGGNVQKVLLGREIKGDPRVIITAYPVRGLDINSSYCIYDILSREKQKGTGVLFVGEDLDVMLALCDRILVLCHGKVMGTVQHNQSTKEQLGLMMTGTPYSQIYGDGENVKEEVSNG